MSYVIAEITISDAVVLVASGLAIALSIGISVNTINFLRDRLRRRRTKHLFWLVRRFFNAKSLESLVVTQREFPGRIQADLQRAFEQVLADGHVVVATGVSTENELFGITLSQIFDDADRQVTPLNFDDIAVGEEQPVRACRNGLWLIETHGVKLALLLFKRCNYAGGSYMQVAIAAPNSAEANEVTTSIFTQCEDAVRSAASYRGKVLSLESPDSYLGEEVGITVHKIRRVERDDVVLPARTIELIERNVLDFVGKREQLRRLGQSTRKGVLLYGPPGNGKTHLIHYLIGRLEGQTTLLISSEQISRLAEYMTLARLLQPSIVVIEDVDLVAQNRESMGPCQETLLNRLLNEMDGLTEQADILFILTTNRPETLEEAIASRPGRIDQAVEFPLPDDAGRRKLVELYSRGFSIDSELLDTVVRRTDKASAAFIKELMRRSVQYHVGHNDSTELRATDVESALDELLLSDPMAKRLLGFAGNGHSGSRIGWADQR